MEQFHYFYGSCLVGRTKTKDGLTFELDNPSFITGNLGN